MSTVRSFHATLSLRELIPIINSVGSHISAKLQQFASDERTLTDELCDMFCIWSQRTLISPHTRIPALESTIIARLPSNRFNVLLSKTTPGEEAKLGADLELILASPKGIKRALFQAKVQDPDSGKLRYASSEGWKKLRVQLRDMRADNGELSFLLIYVPGGELSSEYQGYGTWEQNSRTPTSSTKSSKFGTTVISVDDLIDKRNRWRYRGKVESLGNGMFKPTGTSLSRLILDMVSCSKGNWIPQSAFEGTTSRQQRPAYRSLLIDLSGVSPDLWDELVSPIRKLQDEGTVT